MSTDSRFVHHIWQEQELSRMVRDGVPFPMLSDAGGKIGKIYGVYVENIAISHRTGKLRVGEINLVVAVASAHRREGFAACQHIIDQFKQRLPTRKMETYQDGSVKLDESLQEMEE